METAVITITIIQSIGISLGMGSSTLAILNFFHAIADGKIDETERNFMGITYKVLRVAMGIILTTALLLTIMQYQSQSGDYFTTYITAQSILIAVLFLNALLMTLRIIPSTFGPAIQASTWYSLGFITALVPHGLTDFSLITFILSYVALILLATSFINSVMVYLKEQRSAKSES